MRQTKTEAFLSKSRRDNFIKGDIAALAKRSAFQCNICRAVTVGPSAEAPNAVTNVGVAAHIAAAAPRGARYNSKMTPKQRSHISNAIWLCQVHAKQIDDDTVEWPENKLHKIKRDHEIFVKNSIGIPLRNAISGIGGQLTVREYAFIKVVMLETTYRAILDPILQDRDLKDEDEVGILMVGSSPEEADSPLRETPWTVFVQPGWLRWIIRGQEAGFGLRDEVPAEQIYGQIPAWPDTFFEFLEAMISANTTFTWKRSPKGHLILAQ